MRWLYRPKPISVCTGADGVPCEVDAKRVAAVREEWLVEDGWWGDGSLRRRYFELVLEDGSDVVIFRDVVLRESGSRDGGFREGGSHKGNHGGGRWFRQRA